MGMGMGGGRDGGQQGPSDGFGGGGGGNGQGGGAYEIDGLMNQLIAQLTGQPKNQMYLSRLEHCSLQRQPALARLRTLDCSKQWN